MNHTILLLEPDEDDLYFVLPTLSELYSQLNVEAVKTPRELCSYLADCVENRQCLPSLILLNYNAVPYGVIEIISNLKTDPALKHIPVIVGCGVANQSVVRACYSAGVNSFIQKADNVGDIKASIDDFINYWFRTVLLPAP